jgi:hypothetical protein
MEEGKIQVKERINRIGREEGRRKGEGKWKGHGEGECGREQAGSGRASREGWDGKEDRKGKGKRGTRMRR